MTLPALPTSVIGSYSMPAWLERAKNDYLQRKVSRHDLGEMYDAARKAAIEDQEVAGIDIVSDDEPQRDNMIDYFAGRLPGVQVDHGSKRLDYDFYESVVRSKLATAIDVKSHEIESPGLVADPIRRAVDVLGAERLVRSKKRAKVKGQRSGRGRRDTSDLYLRPDTFALTPLTRPLTFAF